MLRRLSSALASGFNCLHFQSTRYIAHVCEFKAILKQRQDNVFVARVHRSRRAAAEDFVQFSSNSDRHKAGGGPLGGADRGGGVRARVPDEAAGGLVGDVAESLPGRAAGPAVGAGSGVPGRRGRGRRLRGVHGHGQGSVLPRRLLLRHLGFPSVSVLQGGVEAWRAEGLELTTGAPPTPSAGDLTWLKPSEALLATSAEVAAALGDGRTGILDDRDTDEWLGKTSAPPGAPECPRKGRIPGAKWLLWTRLMEKDSKGVLRVKQPVEVRSICAEAGFADLDQPIVIYCFKGARASNTLLAMEAAGFTRLRNFLGSWNEWSRDPHLPVDDRLLS